MSFLRPSDSRRVLLATLGVAAVVLTAAPASAKETASGGTPAPTGCSPVSALKASGDARAGESAVASIDVDYTVKPCDSSKAVTVETLIAEYFNSSVVVWDDPTAPLD